MEKSNPRATKINTDALNAVPMLPKVLHVKEVPAVVQKKGKGPKKSEFKAKPKITRNPSVQAVTQKRHGHSTS